MEPPIYENGRTAALQALPALLLPWYGKNKRDLPWRENTDPYRVLVSELMLQQTRVEAARAHYVRFVRELPDAAALADCPEDKLFKLWEGLGYYSRARNLQKAARAICENGFPETAQALKRLPGVGDYTAGAVASIAFEQPAPAVDGNVVRVLSRYLGDALPAAQLRKRYAAELAPVYPAGRCGDFTQSLMELGATVCLPSSPLCLACPLLARCQTKSDALPLPEKKAERRHANVTMLLFYAEDRIALCRRKNGVLAGMYGFYTEERALRADELAARLQEAGAGGAAIGRHAAHRHVFSHIEWEIDACLIDCAGCEEAVAAAFGVAFYPIAEVRQALSLPSAYRWALRLFPQQTGAERRAE